MSGLINHFSFLVVVYRIVLDCLKFHGSSCHILFMQKVLPWFKMNHFLFNHEFPVIYACIFLV